MDTRFKPHNLHHGNLEVFKSQDPQLSKLCSSKFCFESGLIKNFPTKIPGIYSLTGGRQVGKSTLLKQWIIYLIEQINIPSKDIVYISGEIIDDHHSLLSILDSLNETYIIIDEVTYIKKWENAIKYAADTGILQNKILMLTGSDAVLIQEARQTFPGRRGTAEVQDFYLYPLSFREFLLLTENKDKIIVDDPEDKLLNLFIQYLKHGGYLTAINDFYEFGKINKATYSTYSDWIRGDMQKRGKREIYLKSLIKAIITRYSTQLNTTWNSLAKELPIDHHKTVFDYIELLQSMDAIFIQSALDESSLSASPKKAKKIMFADPFIYHAMKIWLGIPDVESPEETSKIVESTIITHYRRHYPTYYIKSEGEIDLAYLHNKKIFTTEIKWTEQIRTKDLKQIKKYKNSSIFTKLRGHGNISGLPAEYIPYMLANL